MSKHLTRRDFLAKAGSVAAVVGAGPRLWAGAAAAGARHLRLGGPFF